MFPIGALASASSSSSWSTTMKSGPGLWSFQSKIVKPFCCRGTGKHAWLNVCPRSTETRSATSVPGNVTSRSPAGSDAWYASQSVSRATYTSFPLITSNEFPHDSLRSCGEANRSAEYTKCTL